ncbi:hypothetical protein CLM62_30655 [Streptomyces sp. SA15]|uniref:hypothetical protein n=1 Tax=Streptomyces sp. SA15 TaxID=934019 RepID=UPI000BAF459C|nr:hypothetical protein [Streptomyces sp. SA15]PAZ12322.1 hypothetical protein CLM62_30655 [Streptomyces sp. SA15]
MNRDQQHEASKEALRNGWQHEGQERVDHLLTALTHAVLALTAPAPAVPEGPEGKRLKQLLDSVRELGGQSDWRRAQDRFAYLGWPIYADGARDHLKRLAQGGYLTEVAKGVYELATATVQIPHATTDV